MHEVCGLLHLALHKEAISWADSLYDSVIKNEGSEWSKYMATRFINKKKELLSRLEIAESDEERSLITNELKYSFCDEADIYHLFDKIMMRGLRVVYCPEVTDGIPYQETSSNGIASNPSIGYLNVIQG